jgi:HD-GYP domain-containing protein (c-di-GMP phosphodiesterase class II)
VNPLFDRPDSVEEADRVLARRLSIALRTAELHERTNAVAENAASDLYASLSERIDAVGPLTVSTRMRHLFVNDRRVRLGASDYLNLRHLLQVNDSWAIGGLTLLPGMEKAELEGLLQALSRDRRRDIDALRQRLLREHVMHAEVFPPIEDPRTTDDTDLPERTYAACIDVLDELHASISNSRQISARRARRVTQAVVDQMMVDEQALLTLTTIRQFDDHLFTHSANVAILSVGLGQRIGLAKARLGELCLSALLHDLGKIAIPREILEKPGALGRDERLQVMQHPLHSVHILLALGQLSQSTLHAVVGGFEHHLNYDLSGYPPVSMKADITLFGRIITIADRFDALTTPRSYRTVNYTPFEGILYLLENSGTQFDPSLARIFAGMLGLYPPGTVVGLTDGAVGVVTEAPALGIPVHQPKVKILSGAVEGKVVDLAVDGPADGREVIAVYNPGNRGQFPAVDVEVLGAA